MSGAARRYAAHPKSATVEAKSDPKGIYMIQASDMRRWRITSVCAFCAGLTACAPTNQIPPAPSPEPGVFTATTNGPENAPEGTCWGKTVSPAIVERVSDRIEVSPAEINPDGTVSKLPVYRTEDRQVIVTPRQNNWFETPCPADLTVEFVSTLQRALRARGILSAPVTGQMDSATRAAVQDLQRENGLDSAVLATDTARSLGLIAVKRSTFD